MVLRTAIVQAKPSKGHYPENLATARASLSQLCADPPDLVVFPEAAFTGYFLEGAVYELARDVRAFAADLASTWAQACPGAGVDLVAGFFENDGGTYYNSAVYLTVEPDGAHRIVHRHRKMFLPTYGVFDEERFVSRGRSIEVFETGFGTMALLICEDAWHCLVPAIAAIKGATVLLVPSASPGRGVDDDGELTSVRRWRRTLETAAAEHGLFVVYAGLTGFEGGKGMSGSSCAIDPRGRVLVQAPATQACILRADLDLDEIARARAELPLLGDLHAALPDLLLDPQLPLPRA